MSIKEKGPKNSKLKRGVEFDLLVVTESLGYKTYRKDRRNSWSREEDDKLKQLISAALVKLGYDRGISDIKTIQESERICKSISWNQIADLFNDPARKPKDLRKRWSSSLDPNLKKGKWTSEEDAQLLKAYETNGPHWQSVSENIPGRTEDQCAKRYIEVLGPSTEGRLRKWTLEEDLSLVNKVKKYGTKWRRISSEMEFRPSLTCRNRWRKIITSVVRNKAIPEIAGAVKGEQDVSSSLSSFLHGRSANKVDSEDDGSSARETKDGAHMDPSDSNEEGYESSSEVEIEDSSKKNMKDEVTGAIRNKTDRSPGKVKRMAAPGKPQRSSMEWKYTLKDSDELSVSNGMINDFTLVKKLIEQAKKHNLKISIHQHIHNHYNSSQDMNPITENQDNICPSISFDSYSNFRTSIPSPSSGASGKDFLPVSATEIRPAFPENYHEFFSPSPSYNTALGFESFSPSDEDSSRTKTLHLLQQRFSPYAQRSDLLPMTNVASPAVINGENELRGASRHRVSHFNYLPPALKPELESSDSTKASNLNILLNPISSSNRRKSYSKRRRKQGALRSGSNTPISYTSPDDANRQQGSVGSANDDEGLDFWENLRSLAGQPVTTTQQEFTQPNINPFDDESRDLIYGLFDSTDNNGSNNDNHNNNNNNDNNNNNNNNSNNNDNNGSDPNALSKLKLSHPFSLADETFIPFNPS